MELAEKILKALDAAENNEKNMKKFKAKEDGYRYKKGAILELIRKEYDGCSYYRLPNGTEVFACDDNLSAVCQPEFIKGDHVRIRNGKHFLKLGTTGVIDDCRYSGKYQMKMALVSCGSGLQLYIGTQDLELIPKENGMAMD